MARAEISIDALRKQILDKSKAIIDAAIAEAVAAERARVTELEQLAGEILGSFMKTQDGHRARAGQVQIRRWRDTLGETPAAIPPPADNRDDVPAERTYNVRAAGADRRVIATDVTSERVSALIDEHDGQVLVSAHSGPDTTEAGPFPATIASDLP